MMESFGANHTAMTFAGARIEGAIATDSDEDVPGIAKDQIQIV